MATHSSVLAWRIPGMGEPGRPLSLGLYRVGHSRSDLAAAAAASLVSSVTNFNKKGSDTSSQAPLEHMTFSHHPLRTSVLPLSY